MSLYLGEKLISGIGQDRIADTLPIGAIIEWDSDLIPENWLLLNGQAVSRTVYSELFAIYGTTYGAGDGSTTFNLPDRRTRVAVGKDVNDEDFAILGITGGEKEHTLTQSEMPSHTHDYAVYASGGNDVSDGGYEHLAQYAGTNKGWGSYVGYNGGSQPHNNLQPYIVTNFIVKAKLYTTEFIGGNMVIDNLTSDSSVNVLSARMGKELDAKKFDKGEVIDYIVEEGTEGIWTWRKWNSGMAECWGDVEFETGDFVAWGTLYYSSTNNSIEYPFSFIELPVVNATNTSTYSANGWLSTSCGTFSKYSLGRFYILRASTTPAYTANFSVHVIGKWK